MKAEKLHLNPNEMAFRKIYWPLLKEHKLTTIFRPGKRTCGEWRGYCEKQKVTARILERTGADWAMVAPEFSDFSKDIEITNVEAKRFKELTENDFEDSSPDINNTETLRYHLGIIYNMYPEDLSPDAYVTKINFKYHGGQTTDSGKIHQPSRRFIQKRHPKKS